MNGLQPFTISGSDAGLQTNKKPFLLPDKAFPVLENAYVWRDRVKKRLGLELLGRLRRVIVNQVEVSTLSPAQYDTFILTPFSETTGEIEVGSFVMKINPGGLDETIYKDRDALGNITPGKINFISGTYTISSGTILYRSNPEVHLVFSVGPAILPVVMSFNYYPNFPVMGIWQREIPAINDEQTIFFDTKYAYIYLGGAFQEYIAGTTWSGTDADLFWATNWRGSTPQSRLFFVTNFVNDVNNPIRYTDGATWTTFAPAVSSTQFLFQARIIIPYYGRLLALNVYEGATVGTSVNIFNRCRYSQIGDPTAVDAWRSDLFGKGGFIDAPTSEQITSAVFFKNTLIVFFERTTWQLRYVGDYGIPFIWERISSDFGSESTFSTVLFDQGVAAVGDRAIVSSNSITVDRIDLAIPDLVFSFRNSLNGPERVVGIRDFQNELVYWAYNEFGADAQNQKFPNRVLLYNYRNNTYAIFRDNVTFFGTFQPPTSITWDSTSILWGDEGVTWDDPENQSLFPAIVSGNQQGFVHYYNRNTPDDQSLFVSAVDLTTTPIRLTIPNHNLADQETIYVSGLLFTDGAGVPVSTNLNNVIYLARYIDDNTIGLEKWITTITPHQYVNNFSFTPVTSSTYIGGGVVALFPKLNVQTKDFNPYMNKGGQAKLAYVDFLTDATPSALMTVNLYANTQVGSPSLRANILVGNQESETYLTAPYYGNFGPPGPVQDMAWHRFYCTLAAQFIRLQMTYDDDLMNELTTHQQKWILNAITLWTRPGGKMLF